VFGETVRRVTADNARDDIYARNMWWSADEKRYLHRTQFVRGKNDAWDVIDVATGVVTHTGIPFGSFAADGGFDPVNPNVLFYVVENRAINTARSTRSRSIPAERGPMSCTSPPLPPSAGSAAP
jgi:hypothetical protein